jgi:hypothetical protein
MNAHLAFFFFHMYEAVTQLLTVIRCNLNMYISFTMYVYCM